jgi:thiol-disulfide isomerase/thioredoxin
MELFRQFYARRFEQLALGKNGMELLAKVNGTFDYPWLLQLIKNDIYVNQQDTLAELLLIYGLSEAYYDEELFKAEKVLAALNHIGKVSPYPTHGKLAQQVVQRLTYLKPGTAAPTISVIDENGDAIEVVKSGSNKISYIQFWSSRSPSSMREMVLLNALYTKYHPTVEFVSINMDKKGTNWEQLLKNKNYEWTFGIPVDMQELKRSYQLNNYPLYLLVGKNGKIIQYPAATPTESIEKTLYDLSNKKP